MGARGTIAAPAAASPDAAATAQAELFDEAAPLNAPPSPTWARRPRRSPSSRTCTTRSYYTRCCVPGAARCDDLARTVSYDVCGDVFSLNDLAQCVLRGRLRSRSLKHLPEATTATPLAVAPAQVRATLPNIRVAAQAPTPSNARSSFVAAPALTTHWALASGELIGSVSFAAHSGTRLPSMIMEADPATLPAMLDAACAQFLDRPARQPSRAGRRAVGPGGLQPLVSDGSRGTS